MTTPDELEFAKSVQVVSGNPTEEELAAVMSVLKEASRKQQSAGSTQRSTWSRNEQILRTGLVAGNGQWESAYRQGL
jgi:hypothetical protein